MQQAMSDQDMQPVEISETVEVNVVMGAQLRAIVRSALLHVREAVRSRTDIEDESQERVTVLIDEELVKWPLSMEGDNDDTLPQWLYNRFGRYGRAESQIWEFDELSPENQAYWEHEAAAVRRAVGRGGFKTSPEQVDVAPIDKLNEAYAKSGDVIKSLMPLGLKNTESLGEAIRYAIGAASTCWTDVFNAGVFESEKALDISAQLEHHFHSLLVLMNGQMRERHQALADHLHKYWTAGVPMVAVSQVREILTGRAKPEEYTTALQVRPATAAERNRTHLPDVRDL